MSTTTIDLTQFSCPKCGYVSTPPDLNWVDAVANPYAREPGHIEVICRRCHYIEKVRDPVNSEPPESIHTETEFVSWRTITIISALGFLLGAVTMMVLGQLMWT